MLIRVLFTFRLYVHQWISVLREATLLSSHQVTCESGLNVRNHHLIYRWSPVRPLAVIPICDLHMMCNDLGVFARMRQATVSFVMSVCLSVRPSVCQSAWNNSIPTCRFSWNVMFECIAKIGKIQVSLKSEKNNGHFTWRPAHICIVPRPVPLRMTNVGK
jgi:hypothetical protein